MQINSEKRISKNYFNMLYCIALYANVLQSIFKSMKLLEVYTA